MTGALFLACLYSTLLGAITVLLSYVGTTDTSKRMETWCWLFLSIIIGLVLGFSFNRLRLREVGYTYLNALIASGPPSLLGYGRIGTTKKPDEDEE